MMRRHPFHHWLKRFSLLIFAIVLTIFGGTFIFMAIERNGGNGPSFLDALYSVVMVMTGIGADTPKTAGGRIFNIVLALISVGLLVSVLGQIFRLVSGRPLREVVALLHDRKVRAMNGHTILCGSSHTLHELVRRTKDRDSMWIIVRTPEEAKRLEADGVHVHVEDYTTEEALKKAGIENASCVIACGEDDAQNAFVCLSAKHLRKDIPVIVRLTRSDNREKLKAAGADEIISPAELAAAQMRSVMEQFRARAGGT